MENLSASTPDICRQLEISRATLYRWILRRLFSQRFVDRREIGHRDDSKQRLIRASILRN